MALSRAVALVCLLARFASAQQVGEHVKEEHPEIPMWTCAADQCTKQMKSIVLDSNWRWLHNGNYTNCYNDGDWDKDLCPDPLTCARNCHMDGVDAKSYGDTYGIHAGSHGIKMDFVTETKYGSNFGSRVYLMDTEDRYEVFRLKNREFTLTVDMLRMPCGLNGAVYFVEMDADGGLEKSGGTNRAGAKYGTGYCDAQCPHDMKFIDGLANSKGWNKTSDPPVGAKGICCAEMDIWEANSRAAAYTPHPCSVTGAYACEGKDCGDNDSNQRYEGVCDKDGCDFNSYRMGARGFFGRHADFIVDSTKDLTIVTQFLTSDGTDFGDLVEIKRFYVQDGRTIPNSESSTAGVLGSSVSDKFCNAMKDVFGDVNDFQRKGGLKAMGDALDRGMVLVMSLWDDSQANMLWLDSDYPLHQDPLTPGVTRGPCQTTSGSPQYLRSKYPTASVEYKDIMVGPLGTTTRASPGGSASDAEFGDNRRLSENHQVHI